MSVDDRVAPLDDDVRRRALALANPLSVSSLGYGTLLSSVRLLFLDEAKDQDYNQNDNENAYDFSNKHAILLVCTFRRAHVTQCYVYQNPLHLQSMPRWEWH